MPFIRVNPPLSYLAAQPTIASDKIPKFSCLLFCLHSLSANSSQDVPSDSDGQGSSIGILKEVCPNASLSDITHALSVSNGSVDVAAQKLLTGTV